MAKKIFVRAKLVRGIRWYIDFTVYFPSGAEKRHRKDFNLNDIADMATREAVAVRLIENIELFAGVVLSDPVQGDTVTINTREVVTVGEAVQQAIAKKMLLPRLNSRKNYKSVARWFLEWAKGIGCINKDVQTFGRRDANAFYAFYTSRRKYRAATINNYLNAIKGLFTVIQNDFEYIQDNPFSKIEVMRSQPKMRRPFTPDERRIVAAEIQKTDYWLYKALILQFYCYIRPVEIKRLRFKDFDFAKGTVTVRESEAKTWKTVVKTIPVEVMPIFIDGKFEKHPANLLVFSKKDIGKGQYTMAPGTVELDDDRMYKRHKKILLRLQDRGELGDISGLHWYSWKDTGISIHTRDTSPIATKDQAGHDDLKSTMIYYHADPVNEEYRRLKHDLHT